MANETNTSRQNWIFPDPPEKLVFLSAGVHLDGEPITFAVHNIEDGAWQFLGDSMVSSRLPAVVCFSHVIERDPTLIELANLPLGWFARRAAWNKSWLRQPENTKRRRNAESPPLLP